MKVLATALSALIGAGALTACGSTTPQYDGVSRFAGASVPFYGPGSPPREKEQPAPPLPEFPAQGDLSAAPQGAG